MFHYYLLCFIAKISFLHVLIGACNVGSSLWPIRFDDNAAASARIQNWLFYRQNACVKYSMNAVLRGNHNGGFGSAVMTAYGGLRDSILNGHFFLPKGIYVWAYQNEKECSRHTAHFDCFGQPVTHCQKPGPGVHQPSSFPEDINVTDAENLFSATHRVNYCMLGEKLFKPVNWINGQMFIYLMRLAPSLQPRYDNEFKATWTAFSDFSSHITRNHNDSDIKTTYKCVSASLFIRRGPMDFGRIPLNGTEHLSLANEINEHIAPSGKRICTLYISSNDPKGTIFGNATLGRLTPMYGFQVLIMPRFLGDTTQEVELQLKTLRKNPNFHPEQLYIEYLVDLRMLVETDYLIGMWSNAMLLANDLRVALHPEYLHNQTCVLNNLVLPPRRMWFGNEEYLKTFHPVPGPHHSDNSTYLYPVVRNVSSGADRVR